MNYVKSTLPKMFKDGEKNPEYTDSVKKEWEQLHCRGMINSILCYGGELSIENRYLKPYVDTLGVAIVNRLIAEQKEDFSKATVLQNTFTDDEGLSYNTIVWADE